MTIKPGKPVSYVEHLASPFTTILKMFCPLVLFFWVGLPVIFKAVAMPDSIAISEIPAQLFYFVRNPPPLYILLPVSLALLLGLFLTQRIRIKVAHQNLIISRGNRRYGRVMAKLEDIVSCEIAPYPHQAIGISQFFSEPRQDGVEIITIPGFKGSGIKLCYKMPDLGLENPFSSSTNKPRQRTLCHIHFPTKNPEQLRAILSSKIESAPCEGTASTA